MTSINIRTELVEIPTKGTYREFEVICVTIEIGDRRVDFTTAEWDIVGERLCKILLHNPNPIRLMKKGKKKCL